jgi:glycosyltransferase involved in cell wall biosynthesis
MTRREREQSELINIISTQARTPNYRGPWKVFNNLVKGLDNIGYPYVINRDLKATKRLWIQDDIVALGYLHRMNTHAVVGPNLFVMPHDIPATIRLDGVLYIQPSEWISKLWHQEGFFACPIITWPVGIDTQEFQPSATPISQRRVMVYHKGRDVQELGVILETLHTMKLPYWLVLYGRYSEKEYQDWLSKTSFIIWHGSSESQGIAMQEAMACDLPIVVLDVNELSQNQGSYRFASTLAKRTTTSAPYFDDTCGIKITELGALRVALEQIMEDRECFQPRQYVLKHLSLDGQARTFLQIWEHWGLTLDAGYQERATTDRMFSVPMMIRIAKVVSRGLEQFRKQ